LISFDQFQNVPKSGETFSANRVTGNCSHFFLFGQQLAKKSKLEWRHDIQRNDTQHNGTQNNSAEHIDTKHNDTQHSA
jgi:hypothetical protein